MDNPWVRIFLIVPQDEVDTAAALAAQLDPDTGGAETFSSRLSEDGTDPPSHFGASTLVTENTLQMIVDELLPGLPGVRLFQEEEGWTWRKALQDVGLRQIVGWE